MGRIIYIVSYLESISINIADISELFILSWLNKSKTKESLCVTSGSSTVNKNINLNIIVNIIRLIVELNKINPL